MATTPRYSMTTSSGTMAPPQPYLQHGGGYAKADDHDQAATNQSDETICHVQPMFLANSNNNIAFPVNPPGYSVFHPATWQSDTDSMVFMDALQSWGPPPMATNGGYPNDPRHVATNIAWQQPAPLMAWDMLDRNVTAEPQLLAHSAPVQSPYPPVQSDVSYERTVFKTEKPLEDVWESGWVEEIPPSLDANMHHLANIPQAMAINMPVERPPPSHAPRKRRRGPSPAVRVPFAAPVAESALRSPDAPVAVAVQLTQQQHAAPHPSSMFMGFRQVSAEPPVQQFQSQNPGPTRVREPTPILEELPEYRMTDAPSHSTPPGPLPHSPALSAQLVGPVAAPRGSANKVRRGTHAVFKTQSANSKRGHYASDVWEGHKSTIKKLYIDEGKPLREVIKVMETDHDFPATQRMYKARFKQWGFVKNNTEKVVSQILRTKFERDAAGKLSHFTRNGKDVNLQNYLQRKGLTEYDLVDFAAGTDTSSGQSGDNSDESGAGDTLLAHVRCRTPPTDVPGNLRLPDRLRFQDTLVMSFKRAFLMWRQEEQEKDFGMFQPSVFTWRVTDFPHLSKLMESARLIRSGDNASGVAALNQAFWSMNGYLTSMDATASFYFFFHRQSRPWQEDARIALAVWKFLAAYASARNHNNHPLFHTFKLMYEVIQKEGVTGLRELLTESSNTVADELERAFGREHWLKDLIWHRCFPEKSKLRHLQLIRDLRDHGPAKKIVKRLY